MEDKIENPLNIVDQGAHEPCFYNIKDIKWEELSSRQGSGLTAMPKGLLRAIMFGDPNKPGLCIFRMKYPANYHVPPHYHWMAEHTTVLEGSVWVGLGETVDENKMTRYDAGAYFTMPVWQPHYVMTKDNSPIFELHVIGPWQITYCNQETK